MMSGEYLSVIIRELPMMSGEYLSVIIRELPMMSGEYLSVIIRGLPMMSGEYRRCDQLWITDDRLSHYPFISVHLFINH